MRSTFRRSELQDKVQDKVQEKFQRLTSSLASDGETLRAGRAVGPLPAKVKPPSTGVQTEASWLTETV